MGKLTGFKKKTNMANSKTITFEKKLGNMFAGNI